MNTVFLSRKVSTLVAVFAAMVILLMTSGSVSAVQSVTPDGQYDAYEHTTSGVPEVDDQDPAVPITDSFTGTDANGLPWYDSSYTVLDCLNPAPVRNVAGTGSVTTNNCGGTAETAGSNNSSDLTVVEGLIYTPSDATSVSLQNTASGFQAFFVYVSPDANLANLAPAASGISDGVVTEAIPFTAPAPVTDGCLVAEVPFAYRSYVNDRNGVGISALEWSVTGGADDTAGAFVPVPAAFLQSASTYNPDVNNDGVLDVMEASTCDADGDGVTDVYEAANGTDPADACDPDATVGACDADGDGITNAKELADGSDPNDECDPLGLASDCTVEQAAQELADTGEGSNSILLGSVIAITSLALIRRSKSAYSLNS